MGFFVGYLIIAHVLLPLYYKLNLTTIYSYLNERIGRYSYKTGASFFLLSKIIGAAARLYLVCLILQHYVFDDLHIPFSISVIGIVLLIWLYTRKSGIKLFDFSEHGGLSIIVHQVHVIHFQFLQFDAERGCGGVFFYCIFFSGCLHHIPVGASVLEHDGTDTGMVNDDFGNVELRKAEAEKDLDWKLWMMYINSMSDMTFGEWKESVQKNTSTKTRKNKDDDLTDDGIKAIVGRLFPSK